MAESRTGTTKRSLHRCLFYFRLKKSDCIHVALDRWSCSIDRASFTAIFDYPLICAPKINFNVNFEIVSASSGRDPTRLLAATWNETKIAPLKVCREISGKATFTTGRV